MKPGIYTTEFWVTLISGIVIAVCQAFKIPQDLQDAIVKLVVAYIVSRTAVKVGVNINNNKKWVKSSFIWQMVD